MAKRRILEDPELYRDEHCTNRVSKSKTFVLSLYFNYVFPFTTAYELISFPDGTRNFRVLIRTYKYIHQFRQILCLI